MENGWKRHPGAILDISRDGSGMQSGGDGTVGRPSPGKNRQSPQKPF